MFHARHEWLLVSLHCGRANPCLGHGKRLTVLCSRVRQALDIAFQSGKRVYNFNTGVEDLRGGPLSNLDDWVRPFCLAQSVCRRPRNPQETVVVWCAVAFQFADARMCCHVIGRCESTVPLLTWAVDRVAYLRRSVRVCACAVSSCACLTQALQLCCHS